MTDKEVNIMSEIRRGDIWMVDFGVPEDENDHKLHGIRPVVIVSNDSANRHSTVFHAVPLTSKIHKKTYLPSAEKTVAQLKAEMLRFKGKRKLTQEMVDLFVAQVRIYENKNLEIVLNYEDELKKFAELNMEREAG